MTNFKDKIMEEFEKEFYTTPFGIAQREWTNRHKKFLLNALEAQKKELLEEMENGLPQPKRIPTKSEFEQILKTDPKGDDTLFNFGFNDCLSQVKELLNQMK